MEILRIFGAELTARQCDLMNDDRTDYLTAIEAEEARLRERLAKLAQLKELAIELGITAEPNSNRAISPAASSETQARVEQLEPATAHFDGTFGGLIDLYRTHEKSAYHKLKHAVRRNYDNAIDRLKREIGSDRINDWNATRIQETHDTNWAAGGKTAMGQSMVGKLRLLSSFGSVVLNDDDCTRLSTILGNMRFAGVRKRTEILTYAHARAIRATAHSQFGWSSIALAQAFQFEIPRLHQVDIIGRWVPMSEPEDSEFRNGAEKWVGGLLWSDIDDNMILRREFTSGRQRDAKLINSDLRRFAMIMEEINNVPPWKREGPMIRSEFTGVPWSAAEFRRKWRLVADKAGVPSNINFTDGIRGNSETAEKTKTDIFE